MKIEGQDMYEEPYTVKTEPMAKRLTVKHWEGSFTTTHYHDRESLEQYIRDLRRAAKEAGL